MSDFAITDKPSTQVLLDRYLRAWEDHDAKAIAALHTEDSVFHTHIGMPPAVGRPAVLATCEDIFAVYREFRAETTRVHLGDDHWVVEWRMTAQMQTGAAPVAISVDCVDVIALSPEGLVSRKDVYMDVEHVNASLAPQSP